MAPDLHKYPSGLAGSGVSDLHRQTGPRQLRNSNWRTSDKLSNDFEVREIRHLDTTGHQTAVLATERLSREMAARSVQAGSQENFLNTCVNTMP